MAFNRLHVNDLATATLDDSDQVIIGESNTFKKATVGALKNNILGSSPTYTTDTEPYLMRQTAHVGVVGKCALNKLVGGSIGWNQLVQNGNFASGTTNWSGNRMTLAASSNVLTGTITEQNVHARFYQSLNVINGHKYAVLYSITTSAAGYVANAFGNNLSSRRFITSANTATAISEVIAAVANDTEFSIRPKYNDGGLAVGATAKIQNVQIFDLTQMFGSTIADYIYSLEQATAGAGVAWLSRYIDLGTYHAYDAGSIQSVQATEHVTLSKNFLTDFNHTSASETMNGVTFTKNSDGTITLNGTASAATLYYLSSRSVLPTTQGLRVPKGNFILNGTPTGYSSYNLRMGMNRGGSGDTIGNDTGSGFAFTEPEGTAVVYGVWIGFNSGAVFNNVVIKPMVRYADADSTYVPYQKHTYPLGSDTLRGIPQLVSNKLSYDGDEKYPDGTIRRKYGIVDLGSLDWTYTSSSGRSFFTALTTTITPSPKLPFDNSYAFNAIIAGYDAAPMTATFRDRNFGADASGAGNRLLICDNRYTTAAAFKTAATGQYMVYERVTEATEASTSYQKVQTIDADGTESFTTSSPVPVGHETATPDNILAALSWVGE